MELILGVQHDELFDAAMAENNQGNTEIAESMKKNAEWIDEALAALEQVQ